MQSRKKPGSAASRGKTTAGIYILTKAAIRPTIWAMQATGCPGKGLRYCCYRHVF